jgi:VanZ family protein
VKPRLAWLLTGYMLVFLVIYLSLTSQQVNIDMGFSFQDKFYHFIAYFTLMFWFAHVYHGKTHRYTIALAFIMMGVFLEVIQSLTPERYFEYADMVANTVGVVFAYLVMLRRGEVHWLK